MLSQKAVQKKLFEGFVNEAARRGALFHPHSAQIVNDYSRDAARTLLRHARRQFESDDSRARWLDDEMVEARAVQIPRLVRTMVSSARKARQIDAGFVVLHESDSGPAFSLLCPGFWPFC